MSNLRKVTFVEMDFHLLGPGFELHILTGSKRVSPNGKPLPLRLKYIYGEAIPISLTREGADNILESMLGKNLGTIDPFLPNVTFTSKELLSEFLGFPLLNKVIEILEQEEMDVSNVEDVVLIM